MGEVGKGEKEENYDTNEDIGTYDFTELFGDSDGENSDTDSDTGFNLDELL